MFGGIREENFTVAFGAGGKAGKSKRLRKRVQNL